MYVTVQMSHYYLFWNGVHGGDVRQVSIFVAFSITAFIMERTSFYRCALTNDTVLACWKHRNSGANYHLQDELHRATFQLLTAVQVNVMHTDNH